MHAWCSCLMRRKFALLMLRYTYPIRARTEDGEAYVYSPVVAAQTSRMCKGHSAISNRPCTAPARQRREPEFQRLNTYEHTRPSLWHSASRL